MIAGVPPAVLVGVPLALIGLMAIGGSSSAGLGDPGRGGHSELRAILEEAGLDADWITFFEATALRESGFNNLRGLGDPSLFPDWAQPTDNLELGLAEAKAAAIAYDRNRNTLAKCPWPASRYSFGSGGWFGLLPANGVLSAFRGTKHQCIDPWSVFDEVASVAMALGYARGLMGWSGFAKAPTWLNLRLGWGAPSAMGNPESMDRRREAFADQLANLGVQENWMDRKVPGPPTKKRAAQVYAELLNHF